MKRGPSTSKLIVMPVKAATPSAGAPRSEAPFFECAYEDFLVLDLGQVKTKATAAKAGRRIAE